MFNSLLDRLPASAFGLPDRVSRQWILEHSDLAGRIMTKTPDWVEVPIPDGKAGQLFTHAIYVVDCDHEDVCACSDDDKIGWVFVEFYNSKGSIYSPMVQPDWATVLKRLTGEDQ
jgi:hypothetical protein